MLNPANWLSGSRKKLRQALQAIEEEKLDLKQSLRDIEVENLLLKRKFEEMGQETLVLQQQLQAIEGEKLTLQHELRALRSEPPLPRDEQLAIHLSALGERLIERVNVLEATRVESAQPYCWVAEEAEKSREVNRKKKFEAFRHNLESANVKLSQYIDQILDAYAQISTLAGFLTAGGGRTSVGQCEVDAVRQVLEDVKQVPSPDKAWEDANRKRWKEFRPILEARTRTEEHARSEQEKARADANVAFSKYKLPALTPLEKFRLLKHFSGRDGYNG